MLLFLASSFGSYTPYTQKGWWSKKPPACAISGKQPASADYLISTSAPTSSSCFFSSSASSLLTPSLIALGADSTTSFASFRPRPVAPRTALITATLLPPNEVITTSNSVFSSAAAASPPAVGPATATAAAADTLNFSSAASISSTSSPM